MIRSNVDLQTLFMACPVLQTLMLFYERTSFLEVDVLVIRVAT